jgi:hypothetical protein
MRIFALLIPRVMKARLNLTIDNSLLERFKLYAANKQVSISELVEEYFKSATKPKTRKNMIDLVEKLPGHSIPKDLDLKKGFYEEQGKKHGF